ncbi:MAG: translocation/assembly module TamB [Bacteroidia bacterium]|nr:translocation/assembly module TamB [Bacteroidia bacterium]
MCIFILATIKKTLKILLIILLVIVMLPVLASFVLRISSVQTAITQYIAGRLSDKLHTTITIGSVDFYFFDKLVLKKVYIADQSGDTLLFLPSMEARIKSYHYSKDELIIKKITFSEPRIRLVTNKENVLNLQFLLDGLKSDTTDTTSSKLKISCKDFLIDNARFTYQEYGTGSAKHVMNFSNLIIDHMCLGLENIDIRKDLISADIKSLTLHEKSGFVIKEFYAEIKIQPKDYSITGLKCLTGKTDLNAANLDFKVEEVTDFGDFLNKVKIKASIQLSRLSMDDLCYFSPGLAGMDQDLLVAGNISGTVADLDCRKMDIQFGERSVIQGNFSIVGLPDIDKTFIHAGFNRLTTNVEDIAHFHLPVSSGESIKLPDILKKFGTVTYKGSFTGYINDFVAYGVMNSDLGVITSDLAMQKDSTGKKILYTGKLGITNFDLGELLENKLLGKFTMNADIKASQDKLNNFTANLNGKIDDAGFNNCDIHNVEIKGDLAGKRFSGFIYVKDRNLDLDFSGGLDFTDSVPKMNFTALVSHANLKRLNLYNGEGGSDLSFLLKAVFSGDNIDNLNGKINLSEIFYRQNKDSLGISNVTIEAGRDGEGNRLNLQSDMIDIQVNGKYNFESIVSSLLKSGNLYFPSLAGLPEESSSKPNVFDFHAKFKKSREFLTMFFPGLEVKEGTTLQGTFSSESGVISLKCNSPRVILSKNEFRDLSVQMNTTSDSLIIHAHAGIVYIGKSIEMDNFALVSKSRNDSSLLKIQWSDSTGKNFLGNISALIFLQKNAADTSINMIADILPSDVVINDTVWKLSGSKITMTKTKTEIAGFTLQKDDQFVRIDGKISDDKSDSLVMSFNKINLHYLNMFIKSSTLTASGELSGKIRICNLMDNPLIYSDINIVDFEMNEQPLGLTVIKSTWDEENRKLHMDLHTTREDLKPIYVTGDFFPDSRKIDFMFKFDKFRLKFFQPYLSGIMSDMNGSVSDTINLFGTIDKPLLFGKLRITKGTFMIDYLKTRYNFTDYIQITNNAISFDKIRIYDEKGNSSLLSGSINHNYFKDFTLNLKINSENFQVLNTREADNNLYYGTAYTTGVTTITSDTRNIEINVSAKTGKDTRFFIPINSGNDINDNSFVTFVNHDSLGTKSDNNEQPDLSGIKLNFDLEVTPDAEVQIIFNSKTGDIIKARGTSTLRMEINTLGDFNMFGEYLLDGGDYTFTLENFLSKKFAIDKGGSLKWNGDPYNADIDIKAMYSLTASLDGLYQDTSEIYRQRLPVICEIDMTGKLMNPTIKFGIDMPQADEKDRDQLKSLTEDELNKQFLSLILIGRFQPLSFLGNTLPAKLGTTSNISETASEFMSNQLSHWISQISSDFDIGFNYRPGDQLTKNEVDVALKTQLFNNRLSINGKVGTGGQNTQNTNIVGDFEVDYKLNKSGKVRVKAYNNSNDNIYNYDLGPYTQGVGVFYREEFNNFNDLIRKYFLRRDDSVK